MMQRFKKSRDAVTEEQKNKGEKTHFANIMDLCHIKKFSVRQKVSEKQKDVTFEGRIVSATIPMNYVEFTKQSTSASHMTVRIHRTSKRRY